MLVPHVHADADGAPAQVPGSGPGASGVAAGDRYHRGGIEQRRGHSRPEPARTAGDEDPDPVPPRARSAHEPKLARRRNRGPVNDQRTPESVPALAEPARQPHAIGIPGAGQPTATAMTPPTRIDPAPGHAALRPRTVVCAEYRLTSEIRRSARFEREALAGCQTCIKVDLAPIPVGRHDRSCR